MEMERLVDVQNVEVQEIVVLVMELVVMEIILLVLLVMEEMEVPHVLNVQVKDKLCVLNVAELVVIINALVAEQICEQMISTVLIVVVLLAVIYMNVLFVMGKRLQNVLPVLEMGSVLHVMVQVL